MKNLKTVKASKFINAGGYKECYLVKGRPSKVVLTPLYDHEKYVITREINHLNKLRKMGLPVIKATKVKVIRGNGQKPIVGIMCERFKEGGVRVHDLSVRQVRRFRRTLLRIKRVLEKRRIEIEDMQFCMDKDRLVLADPLDVYAVTYRSESVTEIESALDHANSR